MFPPLSPIESPQLVCVACATPMRRVITKNKKTGALQSIKVFCDTEKCKYGMDMSREHKNCQPVPYEPPTGN